MHAPNYRGAAQRAPLRSWLARIARVIRAGALLLLLSTGTACYSYTLVDPAQVGTGLDVRARITPVESARIEELTGFSDRVLQGQVVDVESSALVLSIPTVIDQPGASTSRLHQRITLPSSAIVELEQRRLDRWRTFSLLGVAAAAAGYLVVTQFASDGGGPGTDKGPPVENLILNIRALFR